MMYDDHSGTLSCYMQLKVLVLSTLLNSLVNSFLMCSPVTLESNWWGRAPRIFLFESDKWSIFQSLIASWHQDKSGRLASYSCL